MGIINAADELTGSPNSSHKANSGRSEHRPELLGDLTAKIMPIIQGLVEENKQLKDQLWRDHYFLWQTPVFPSRNLSEGCSSSGYEGFQGTEVYFVHKVFANLKEQLLAIITDLAEENHALKNKMFQYDQQLPELKDQFSSRQAEFCRKKEAHPSNLEFEVDLEVDILRSLADILWSLIDEISSVLLTNDFLKVNNDFLKLSQSKIIREGVQKKIELAIDSMKVSWEEVRTVVDTVHTYVDEMLINFNNDTLFVHGNDQHMTVGTFKNKVQVYFNGISLQPFCKSKEQEDLSNKILELCPKIYTLDVMLDDDDQDYLGMLEFFNSWQELKTKIILEGEQKQIEFGIGSTETSWKKIHKFLDKMLINFNNNTLFVYGNDQHMTVGTFKNKVQAYFNEISLQPFCKSEGQEDFSNQILELCPKIITWAAIIDDDDQYYLGMLYPFKSGSKLLFEHIRLFK